MVTFFIGLAAFLGGFIFGLDIGTMTGSIRLIQNEFSSSSGEAGLIASTSLFGCIIGSVLAPLLSVERKKLIFLSSALFILGNLGLTFSETLPQLFFFRVLIGVAIGFSAFAIPLYVAELAPKEKRGGLVSIYQFSITLGILSAFFLGYAHAGELLWRPLFLYNGTLAAIFLILLPLFPSGEPIVLKKHPILKKPLFIGLGLALFQQVTGINGIIFFAPTLLYKTGVHDQGSLLLLTASIGIVNSLTTLLCIGLIDRVGRRPLLIFSLSGMALSLLFLTLISSTLLTLVGLIGYIFFFAIGIGPLFWVVCSELFAKGGGMGLATLVNWMANFLVSSTFLLLVDWVDLPGTFLVYCLVTLGALYFVWRSVPETKGRSLESILQSMDRGIPTK